MNRVVHIFPNTHMGLAHDGLQAHAAEYRVNLSKLEAGQHAVFINRQRNKGKMYSPNHVIHYLRLPKGDRLRMETLQYFPQCFTKTGELDYDAALAKSFPKFLATRTKETDSRKVL